MKATFNKNSVNNKFKPQDNLFKYVNDSYLNKKIPDNQSSIGTFSDLRNQSLKHIRKLCEENPDTLYGKLYRNYLDTKKIEKKYKYTVDEIKKVFAKITSLEQFNLEAFKKENRFFDLPLAIAVFNNPENPDYNIMHLEQSGLSLPDKSYYTEPQFEPMRQGLKKIFREILEFIEFNGDIEKTVENLYAFEATIASYHYDLNQLRDVKLNTNIVPIKDVKKYLKNLDIYAGLKDYKIKDYDQQVINLSQLEYVKSIDKFWTEANLQTIKDWNLCYAIITYGPALSKKIRKAIFDFNRLFTGQLKPRPRWKRAISYIDSSIGESVGSDYVKLYFPESYKKQIDELVNNLIEAYRESISSQKWLDEQTKKNALKKLDRLTVKIGYPKKFEKYEGLVLNDDLFDNFRAIEAWHLNDTISEIGKKVDKDKWLMNPQTVNAYFHPLNNEIVFPAAVLQFPFFDPKMTLAENYGAIGAVIGHEIGHCFDDQGAKFDWNGALKNWWTEKTEKKFEALGKKLVKQYDKKKSIFSGNAEVDGHRTLGENIGDLGGLSIALKAYVKAVGGDFHKEDTKDWTALQLFFLSWARSWRINIRKEDAKTQVATDVHAPGDLRANIPPSNLAAFYDAFDIKPKNKLYLAPKDRVEIW